MRAILRQAMARRLVKMPETSVSLISKHSHQCLGQPSSRSLLADYIVTRAATARQSSYIAGMLRIGVLASDMLMCRVAAPRRPFTNILCRGRPSDLHRGRQSSLKQEWQYHSDHWTNVCGQNKGTSSKHRSLQGS